MASTWDPPTGSAFSDRVIAPVLPCYLATGGKTGAVGASVLPTAVLGVEHGVATGGVPICIGGRSGFGPGARSCVYVAGVAKVPATNTPVSRAAITS